MASQTNLRRGMRFRSHHTMMARIQVSSPNVGWCQITANDRVTSNGSSSLIRSTRDRTFPLLGSGFRLSAVGYFICADDAENSESDFGRLSETRVRFNWTNSDIYIYIYISKFKCKLIDPSTVHDNRTWVTMIYRIVFFLQYLWTSTGNHVYVHRFVWIWRLEVEKKNVHLFVAKKM